MVHTIFLYYRVDNLCMYETNPLRQISISTLGSNPGLPDSRAFIAAIGPAPQGWHPIAADIGLDFATVQIMKEDLAQKAKAEAKNFPSQVRFDLRTSRAAGGDDNCYTTSLP